MSQGLRPNSFAASRLAALPANPGLPRPASVEEVAAVRQRGLGGALELMRHALAESTWAKQQAAALELSGWLAEYGEGGDISTCTPEDILIYIMEHWLQAHKGRKRSDGLCGPAALKSTLSSLSGFFLRLGREGRYDGASGGGNPCDSVWMEDFRKAFERVSMVAGYVEHSAVPLTEATYRQLVSYLWGLFKDSSSLLCALMVLRDLLCSQYMWVSTQRGHDTGKLGLADFVDPADPSKPFQGFPLPAPHLWPATYTVPTLCVAERGTKTSRVSRAPPVFLSPNLAEPELCFVRTLALYMSLARHPSAPPGSPVIDHLFRPLRRDKGGFQDAPFSSAALGARVRLHLMMSGVYGGETNHSFRRGGIQFLASQGASLESLHAQSQLRSVEVLKRYMDGHRHHGARRVRPRGL